MGTTLSAKMTLKDGYRFGGFSGTPPSEPNLSTPPPRDRPTTSSFLAGPDRLTVLLLCEEVSLQQSKIIN